jgi:hypothetical protein
MGPRRWSHDHYPFTSTVSNGGLIDQTHYAFFVEIRRPRAIQLLDPKSLRKRHFSLE